jgi:hypothetical protein
LFPFADHGCFVPGDSRLIYSRIAAGAKDVENPATPFCPEGQGPGAGELKIIRMGRNGQSALGNISTLLHLLLYPLCSPVFYPKVLFDLCFVQVSRTIYKTNRWEMQIGH